MAEGSPDRETTSQSVSLGRSEDIQISPDQSGPCPETEQLAIVQKCVRSDVNPVAFFNDRKTLLFIISGLGHENSGNCYLKLVNSPILPQVTELHLDLCYLNATSRHGGVAA